MYSKFVNTVLCVDVIFNFTHSEKYYLFDKFTMEKKTFMTKLAVWTAVVTAVIIAIIGLCFGHVIEGSLFKEVTKWIVVGLGVIAILEGLIYSSVGPLIWHMMEKKKDEKTDTVGKA